MLSHVELFAIKYSRKPMSTTASGISAAILTEGGLDKVSLWPMVSTQSFANDMTTWARLTPAPARERPSQ